VSGLDLLAEIRSRWPGTRTILVSGGAEVLDAAAAIEHGVDQLLVKPFSLDDLKAGVEKALAQRQALEQAALERKALEAELHRQEIENQSWLIRSAHALAAAVEAKDMYTAGHAARVTNYALIIAEEIAGADLARLRLAGGLHDVGKIGVPDLVLNKTGRLTSEELRLIKKHPEAGERILGSLLDDPFVLGAVRSHHERWDGGGYPDGLSSEAIPLPARILAVADTLDAMTSSRAYRAALPWDVAAAEICRCAGTQFDPLVVEAFQRALPKLEFLHRSSRKNHGAAAAA
jgi:HD-GYP domain-containing protein (c-di-GMP phosphodiesterase class II)